MIDTRSKDTNWKLNDLGGGKVSGADAALAVLMDLRDELKELNHQLRTSQFCTLRHDTHQTRRAIERIDKRMAKRISLKPPRKP